MIEKIEVALWNISVLCATFYAIFVQHRSVWWLTVPLLLHGCVTVKAKPDAMEMR